ncbi:MAG: response regulator [Burkholderiales bacterium]
MENSAILIGTIGLTENDVRVLLSLARITKSRARSYVIRERDVAGDADILIVDGERPEAVQQWRAVCERKAVSSIMLLPKSAPGHPAAVKLARPLVASSLLHALDSIKVVKRAVIAPDANLDFMPLGTLPAPNELETRVASRVGARTAEVKVARALVIDDSPTVRKQLELALRSFKVDVDSAESGEDGLRLLNSGSYAIVFLDVVLPGWDGYQICKTIKRDKSNQNTPVVMLTSRSSPFDRIRGSLAGCDSYLTKPVNDAVFEGVLKKYLFAAVDSSASNGPKSALA